MTQPYGCDTMVFTLALCAFVRPASGGPYSLVRALPSQVGPPPAEPDAAAHKSRNPAVPPPPIRTEHGCVLPGPTAPRASAPTELSAGNLMSTMVEPGPLLERIYNAHDARGGWWECYEPKKNDPPRMYAYTGDRVRGGKELVASFPLPMREEKADLYAERLGIPRNAYRR